MVWSSDSEMLPLRMMGTRNLFAYFFCFGMLLSSVAQEGLDRNEKDYIKTIQFSSLKQNDAFPIVALNEKILLKFDDLNGDEADYYYRISYFNHDWSPSTLFKNELNWTIGIELFNDANSYQTYKNLYNTVASGSELIQGELLSNFKERRTYFNLFFDSKYTFSKKIHILFEDKHSWAFKKVNSHNVFFKGVFWFNDKFYSKKLACEKLAEIFARVISPCDEKVPTISCSLVQLNSVKISFLDVMSVIETSCPSIFLWV